jgi:hypothetical protein
LLRKSDFMPLLKFSQAQSRLDEFSLHHLGLLALLVIPSEEAKDENQKHLCCANLILCPCKNSLKRRAAWMNFLGA